MPEGIADSSSNRGVKIVAINWNGVIGSVASVINTALPLFLGGAKAQAAGTTSVRIGPATLFKEGGVLKLGNFGTGGGSPDVPILINFTSPEGDVQENLAVQLALGQSFNVEPWLEQYTYGDTSLGVSHESDATVKWPPLSAYFTYSSAVRLPSTPLAVIVNPQLTLQRALKSEGGRQILKVTPEGEASYLVGSYVATAVNNSGQSGPRSGTLLPEPGGKPGVEDEANSSFIMELPSGIDYSQGIYQLQLQLPINLEGTSVATHPDVIFETVA